MTNDTVVSPDGETDNTRERDLFYVVAGKYEGDGSANVKVSDSRPTLDEAIELADSLKSYPWVYIQYKDRYLCIWPKGFNLCD